MNLFRLTAIAAAAFLSVSQPVAAQWQTPSHSVPIGRGGGIQGFRFVAPGTAGLPFTSNGATVDPTFQLLPNGGLATGAANTVKGTVNGTATVDLPLPSSTCNAVGFTPGTGFGCPPSAASGYISPLSYGAKCDGATHDETAFQNALNAAIAAQSTLQIPVGNCVLNANITNGTGLFVPTQIAGFGVYSQVTFLGSFGFSFNAQASYYNLRDFQINCQTASTNPCLKIFNASQSTAFTSVVQHVSIASAGAYGMFFQNMSETILTQNFIQTTSTGSYGLYIDNSQTADVGGNLITGNIIINSAASSSSFNGIHFINVGGTRTIGNAVDGYNYAIFYQNSISSGAATGIQILDNQLDDFITAGINFASSALGGAIAHVNITGNTLHAKSTGASGSAGIVIAEQTGSTRWASNVAINSNTMDTLNGDAGILVAGVTGLAVVGNSISDQGTPVGAAITITASPINCTVTGNGVTQYSTHLSNGPPCTAAGNN